MEAKKNIGTVAAAQAAQSSTATAELRRKSTVVDVTDYDNLTLSLSNWQAVEGEITAAMQRLWPRQAAAEKLLAADPPAYEKSQAEGTLVKISEESRELEDRLARAQLQIKTIQGHLRPMEAEVKKQKNIRSLVATLRASG
jgi:hypothetical protein